MQVSSINLAVSAPRGAVPFPAPTQVPTSTGAPSIAGIATVGQTVTGDNGSWDQPPILSYTYQHQDSATGVGAGTDIPGATSSSYVLAAGQLTKYFRRGVKATNAIGSAAAFAYSAYIGPVVAAPSISGTPDPTGSVGGAYSFAPSKSGGHGAGVWTLSGSLGASGLSFSTSTGVLSATTLGPAATYGPYSVYWTDSDGIQSNTIGPWSVTVSSGSVPVNSVAPAITGLNADGTADPGQVLTCSTGTWSATPTGYSYQWKLAGVNVGTNSNTYTPTDVGPTTLAITCVVTASNGVGAGTPATSNSVNTFHPVEINTLTSRFDTEVTASITMSSNIVSAITSTTPDAISLSQGTGSFRPVYSPTAVNGRPGIGGDGVDDYLRASGTFSPSGATAEEIWAVATQDLPTNSGSFRFLFAQGSGDPTGSGGRQLLRNVVSSQSRAAGQIETTGIVGPTSVAWVGAHVARMRVGATSTQIDLDNQAGTPNSIVPNSGNSLLSMFCAQNSTPGAFWSGSMNCTMRFSSLTASRVQSLYRWCGMRAGLALP